MKNYKEILKSKIILERRQDQTEILGDEGTGTIDVYGYGQDMPNMPTPPRGIVRTREYPGIVIHSVNTFTDGNRRGDNGRGYGRGQPTIGNEAEDFGPDDVNYNKEAESNTPATPYILAGAVTPAAIKGSLAAKAKVDRARRLARGVIGRSVPSHQQIATRASGLNVGDDVANWLNAEKALKAEQEALRLGRPLARASGTSAVTGLEKALNTGKLGGVARTADQATDLLRAANASDALKVAGAAEHLKIPLAGKEVSKPLAWTAAKTAGKIGAKAALRAVPFVGAAADLGLASADLYNGKWGRALARLGVGAAGLGVQSLGNFIAPGVAVAAGTGLNLIGNTLIDTLWEHRDVGYYQNKLIERLDDKRYSKYMLSE